MSNSPPAPTSERPEFANPSRRYGMGLRSQTLLVLTAAFVLSFSGLSIIVVGVAQKAQVIQSGRRHAALVEAVGLALPAGREDELQRALARLLGHADVIGVELSQSGGTTLRLGDTSSSTHASAWLPDGAKLVLFTDMHDAQLRGPLAGLLRLYSFVTGALILLIVYVVLTRLIVRPVENLTHAVEKLPRAGDEAAIKVVGAAELSRLAVSFNRMARELRGEKRALEARLHELEETTRVLRSTQDQLIRSEKLAGVGRLAAGIAHEIGNPLAAILGLVELLQMGSTSRAEESEFLTRIHHETERIHRIIRDLLDYARVSPLAHEPQREEADLERVVEEAVALVAPQKDLRRVTLERRVFGRSLKVAGSAHELTQIVLNLLLNAADAVSGDGHILVELTQKERSVELAVSDTGAGIASEVRDKLFEPFVTTKPVGKGTGLGLAVCQAVVERLGGSIAAENLPHKGARFTVSLPAA